MNLEFDIRAEQNSNTYTCFATIGLQPVCICKINVSGSQTGAKTKWTISRWYTKTEYRNQGIGKQTLKCMLNYLCQKYDKPDSIEYIWDGKNEYVGDWLRKYFDAECKCSIAVQKMHEAEDDWDSHVYNLQTDKVLAYFEL